MKFPKNHKIFLTVIMMIVFMTVILSSSLTLKRVEARTRKEAYVNVQTVLNLREGPSTERLVIQKLRPYETVLIESEDEDGWTFVRTATGQYGYVKSEYIVVCSERIDLNEQREEPQYDEKRYTLISTAVITAEKSSENRNFNMSRACSRIDSIKLTPGSVFAWYDVDKNYDNAGHIAMHGVVGPANKANGYKKATVISDGKYVTGYGGGVCQVSTALFNCIDQLGIIPIEHHHHTLQSSYVEEGMDATVAYSENEKYRKNFVFRNTLDYTILFEAYSEGGQVVVNAYRVNY